jgi:arsenical pump membrane protein
LTVSGGDILTWAIAGTATAGVIVRPFRWPEAVWAGAGAILLIALGLLSPGDGLEAIGKGLDVYLFLIGMMLLSEVAQREGLFGVVAAMAVNAARGSTARLFLLIYVVGVVVTTFLSNDATAVVPTPAVFAAARKAKADPLPLLFICAFVANAASFVLPISNPANLVLYAAHTPPLLDWLKSFAAPAALSILATYATLRWVERKRLGGVCANEVEQPPMTAGSWAALAGIGVTAVALIVASALNLINRDQLALAAKDAAHAAATARVDLATAIGVPAKALDLVTIDLGAISREPSLPPDWSFADLRRRALTGRADVNAASPVMAWMRA